MDRDVNAFNNADAWRIAALSTMGKAELHALLSGDAAAMWVTAAANSGLPEAQLRLGRMLLSGEGMAKDEAAACAWFTRAAQAGDIEAHNMLGRCLEYGWGVARDPSLAAHHYTVAAEAGAAWAQYNLGHLFLDGIGVTRNFALAFASYSRAAAQGHARAMNLVARCHEEGWSVPRNATLARAWYRKSAEGGYFRGVYNYATMLVAEGCLAGAAHWFEIALTGAPEPTRSAMAQALAQSPHAQLRAFGMNALTGATEGLI